VALGADVERHVIAARLQPLDVAGGHHQDPGALAHEHPGQVAALVERLAEAVAVGQVRRDGGTLPGSLDRGLEANLVEGLEQVVHGLQLERRDGVAVERGGEDDGGPVAHPPGHFQPAETGHGQAQQGDVGAKLVDQAERGGAVTGLAHHAHVRGRRRKRAEPLP
jgi:hypothetical protein